MRLTVAPGDRRRGEQLSELAHAGARAHSVMWDHFNVPGRVDEHGRAFKKSQLQMQLWVNRRQKALTAAVVDSLPLLAALDPDLEWVSPLEKHGFVERYDVDFLLAIQRPDLVDALRSYWPSGGPHWDALAVAHAKNGEHLGPVLFEAKSYPDEMRSKLSATDAESRRRIEQRLAETRAWLGVADGYVAAWSKRWYQAANRYAHLRWFREVLGERAWLVNVYFLDDPSHPTDRETWDDALITTHLELGLSEIRIADCGDVFLPAGDREELLAPLNEDDLATRSGGPVRRFMPGAAPGAEREH